VRTAALKRSSRARSARLVDELRRDGSPVSAMDEPPVDGARAPERSPYDRLGGQAAVRALVDRFYDLMELEPAYGDLRRVHGSELAHARDKLAWFLSGWLGGPDLYVERFGHPRLRARHLPFAIGVRERDQWLACMQQAMVECGVEEPLRARLARAFFQTADWMRNQAG
jgi:hemoglobin